MPKRVSEAPATVVLVCTALALLAWPGLAQAQEMWVPPPAIQCPGITAPSDGDIVYPDTEVTCTVATASDQDTRLMPNPGVVDDTISSYTWSSGGVGSWKDGINTGQTVTWIAPTTGANVTLTCTIDDTGGDPYRLDRDDTALDKTVSVKVVRIELTHIKFNYSSGSSTSLTATVLTDSHANWLTNEFQTKKLNPDITQSTTFTVASNTQTTITISAGDMTDVASVGDKYAVLYDDDALSIRKNYTTLIPLPEW